MEEICEQRPHGIEEVNGTIPWICANTPEAARSVIELAAHSAVADVRILAMIHLVELYESDPHTSIQLAEQTLTDPCENARRLALRALLSLQKT